MVEDLSESRHFGSPKWRASRRGVHLDLYVPHQSRLGANLQLRVEQLAHHTETRDGKRLLTIPGHTATKWAALLDRPDSRPGRKDRYEILRLLKAPGAEQTPRVIKEASSRTSSDVAVLLRRLRAARRERQPHPAGTRGPPPA